MILYFSRKPLLNDIDTESENSYYKVLGLYGMSRKNLLEFASLKQGKLEMAEKVELLRWLENGNSIRGTKINTKSMVVAGRYGSRIKKKNWDRITF